tara:strand:+ start:4297 stop:4488 length:192 start_codon:yes stop_codon:yes gene_type:complete
VKIETELPEILFKAMKDFIELNPQCDQYSFIKSALNNFLYKNGCEDRRVAENYLDDIFGKSPS